MLRTLSGQQSAGQVGARPTEGREATMKAFMFNWTLCTNCLEHRDHTGPEGKWYKLEELDRNNRNK